MKCKRACLVVNPRDGQNLSKLTGIMSVFSAAGWHTDVVLKEYPGHTMELAKQATEQDYDLVISYGGDGTLNQARRYADSVEMTADAFIDDGMLDVCVITAGEPLSTMQQVTSILLRRKSDTHASEFFRATHLSIRVPASIAFHVDGSAVKLKDYLSKSDRNALRRAENAEHVMVTYQFDALSRALQVAIPSTYNETLFQKPKREESSLPVTLLGDTNR